MGAVSTLCQASSSVLLFSQAFGDHCRGLSSSSICFFNNNRKSRGRWATFGTLLLSYSSTVGGVGGRRTVVSNLNLKGSGGDHIEGSDAGFDGDDGSNNSNDNDTGNGDGASSESGSMSMSPKLNLAYAALVGEETKRRASSQSCDNIKAGDSTNNPVSVGNPNAVTPGLGNDKLSSVRTVALWVCAAVTFGVVLGMKDGVGKASEFFAGYLLEQSLSVDNLFVFVLIFRYFKVPIIYQSRVLSYGIAGAIIFRASMILLGTATLQRFEVVNLLLASILLFSSYKLFAGEEEEADLSDNFIVKTCQKFIPVTSNYDGDRFFKIQDGAWQATPLLLTVAVIELSDIAFAVDSIPAVFGVTRDPFIVFSSNLFAILGLRSLYTLISESMSELEYIQPAIGVVLGFIGCKMILDFFGYHISTEASLGLVATSLSCGVLLSLIKKKSD